MKISNTCGAEKENIVQSKDLIGKKLDGFSVQIYTEVYRVNEDGKKIDSLGFFRNSTIAKAFADGLTDAPWHQTEQELVLTNGEVGFLLGESVKLLSDEQAALEVKEKALAKLTPEEIELLKL